MLQGMASAVHPLNASAGSSRDVGFANAEMSGTSNDNAPSSSHFILSTQPIAPFEIFPSTRPKSHVVQGLPSDYEYRHGLYQWYPWNRDAPIREAMGRGGSVFSQVFSYPTNEVVSLKTK